MKFDEIIEGTEVSYHQYIGTIRFVSHSYITLCVQTFPEKVRDTCLLIYPDQWKDLHLLSK
jgi:hypothetical protein